MVLAVSMGLPVSVNPVSISLTGVVETHLQGHSRSGQSPVTPHLNPTKYALYFFLPSGFLDVLFYI